LPDKDGNNDEEGSSYFELNIEGLTRSLRWVNPPIAKFIGKVILYGIGGILLYRGSEVAQLLFKF
jgi:hypothetical protein